MHKLFIYLVLVVSSFVAPIKPVAAETTVPKFEAVSCPFVLTAGPILLGLGVPSTLGWVALLSAAGSFVFSVDVTKRYASTTGN